ncbi:Pleiotropic drug resistance ABC transporter protein [Mycena indigotica]|uniref:Pleiotropic drug resistance ABC transporter protein n=2 Tax=Mycena indigotica TaxID=2126181 RepID=A0A8H6SZ01_9AGAR|nr:Pleiotropic drug resistance ABC transporter protein [Mycena indigotica]KAF7307372.1 Pleiotropic drug resistance ABC transporter protein [Mycena indigotica]
MAGQSAWNVVRLLRKLADQGQAILCTIHQPSALLFESFDRLLLLERGGETVYFGDIGKDSHVIRNYFAANGAFCPANVNPAEYMLEAIGAGTTPRVGDRDWKDIWLDSPECESLRSKIAQINNEALTRPVAEKTKLSTYATPFMYQLRTVTARNYLALWRSPDYLFSRLFVCSFISFFVSLSFLQLGISLRDLQFRVFSLFWVTILPAIIMAQIEPMFISNRRTFIREASSRIYSPYVFAIAQTLSEIPGSIVCAIVYWVLMVYPMHFGQGAAGLNGTGFQLLMTLTMMIFGVTLGQLIGAISPSVQVAALYNPFLTLVLGTFCGVTLPHVNNGFWWTWLYQLVPYTRTIAAMVSTELFGLKVRCKSVAALLAGSFARLGLAAPADQWLVSIHKRPFSLPNYLRRRFGIVLVATGTHLNPPITGDKNTLLTKFQNFHPRLTRADFAAGGISNASGLNAALNERERVCAHLGRSIVYIAVCALSSLGLLTTAYNRIMAGQSAWNVVRLLRKLADQGQAILCTIHQPSALLFESFDRLLLLERGGETVYFGDIGKDSHVIRNYFAANGAFCPANVNPAEYMLEAIGAGTTPRVGDRDWKDIWLDSPECESLRSKIAQINNEALTRPVAEKTKLSTYATPFMYQLRTVTARNYLALWRSPDYLFSRLFVCSFISFFVSLSFLQLGISLRDLQFRVFSLFWVTILPAIIMAQIEPMFISNRRTFIREASSRIYSPYVFAIAQTLSEIPGSIVCAIVYWVLMVYPMHFGQGAAGLNGTGFQLLMTLTMMIFGVTLGQLIGAISPSVQVAALYNPFLTLVLGTFCGVTLPHVNNGFWWTWLYQLVPYTRTIAAMVSTELFGLKVRCKSDEFATFNPPTNMTCGQWGQAFVNITGGYIDNLDATSNCKYCSYAVGDEFYTPLGISFSERWRDFGIFLAYIAFNMAATVIASRYLRYAKR